jgi:hypothetical protein
MYRSMPQGRPYVCPRCASVELAPMSGGSVACSKCRTPSTLPDRSAVLSVGGNPPMPSNDPQRLAQLRLQDGRPRMPTPTLLGVLGGPSIQPGREAEAIAIWQSLRARSAQNDVGASEDLALLTLMLAQHPAMEAQGELAQALTESALDVVVLPRHRQEMLGRLCRVAASRGDRQRALGLLSAMNPNTMELDSDSECRLSGSILGAIDRDGARMLHLLGPQKDAIPIADSMDEFASVLRAHAYELTGNVQAASQILRELPSPRTLAAVQARYPMLQLCAQSAHAYTAVASQQAAQRAAASAGGIGLLLGGILAVSGLIPLLIGIFSAIFADDGLAGAVVPGLIGLVLLVIGVVIVVRARASAKRASWLRLNGLSLTARIAGAGRTGTTINDVPVMRFQLQVAGPQGPYAASFDKLVPEHQVAMMIGHEVRVRANPQQLSEVILEE